jgi:hypothetical protein
VIETRTSFRVIEGELSSKDLTYVDRSVFKSKMILPELITSHSSNDSKNRGIVPNLLITRLSLVLLEAISHVPYVLALPVWEPIGDQRFVSALQKQKHLKFQWEASRFVAKVKVKVKVTLEQATKAQRGSRRGTTTLSLTSALDVVGGQRHASAALSPGKEIWCPLYRRLGGPQGRSGQVMKSRPPPRFDPRTVQPVASRYTD